MQPEWFLIVCLITEMFNFNALSGRNSVTQPLPVVQPGLRDDRIVVTRQQQDLVNITRQAWQLVTVAIAQRLAENAFQFSGMAGKMDIGKAFEGIAHFTLRFGI